MRLALALAALALLAAPALADTFENIARGAGVILYGEANCGLKAKQQFVQAADIASAADPDKFFAIAMMQYADLDSLEGNIAGAACGVVKIVGKEMFW